MRCPICNLNNTRKYINVGNSQIMFCKQCKNAWTFPPPNEIEYTERDFHGQFQYETIEDLPQQWKRASHMQINLLEKYLKREARILEIGCGQGIMLSELKRRGYDIFGIEPSIAGSQIAKSKGLNVVPGYFPSDKNIGTFDAVILIQVLEHISKPFDFLNQIAQIVPNGFVLFVQTNWRGLVPRVKKEKWYAWVPEEHFWHFSPDGLANLLTRIKGHVMEVEFSSLEHNNSFISRIGTVIKSLGDQFHLIAKIPGK
jgi:2-polyprenyl-3-methyl-5-hydroxy-6-metoxy-1,4-benzoquinol methylase